MVAVAQMADDGRQTHIVEDHLIVLNGSRSCPHPSRCDQRKGETYDAYVRRHAEDHDLGGFMWLEDAERNLGLWCFFYFSKYIQGNPSLGVGDAIVAAYEPCWEDSEILANDTFSLEDTEQEIPWEQRTFKLKPAVDRKPGVFKPWKKLTKVRGTQKTSRGLALVTWRQLRAYFIENNPSFRVLVISATSTHAFDSYFEPLKTMWSSNEELQRLYGKTEYTARYHLLKRRRESGKLVSDAELEGETRRLACLMIGSKGKTRLRLRWNITAGRGSSKASYSVVCAGIRTVLGGKRWDMIIVDDPVVIENAFTQGQRKKVSDKIAELRKEADAACEFVWFNTPFHLDDASAKIDKDQGAQWHIFYRPGFWKNSTTGQIEYYWQRDALGREVWTKTRIENERSQPDFYTQVALRMRYTDEDEVTAADFRMVSIEECPIGVRYGLGRPLTDIERSTLDFEKITVFRANFCDTAGKAEQTTKGDRCAVVGVRVDSGVIFVTHIRYGFWTVMQEEEEIYNSCIRNQPDFVEYEISGKDEKYIKQLHVDFQARKSGLLRRPVVIPFRYQYAQTHPSKRNIDSLKPLVKTGRLRILEDAGTADDIARLKDEIVNAGFTDHDDGADALARIIMHMGFLSPEDAALAAGYTLGEGPKPGDEAPVYFDPATSSMTVSADFLEAEIGAALNPRNDQSWGLRGRP